MAPEKHTPPNRPELFEVDIKPIHHVRHGGPLIETAGDQVHLRIENANAAAKLAADIEYLQELRELPPRRNIFKRRRQQRALASWLERNYYTDPDEAHSELSQRHARAIEDTNVTAAGLEEFWFPRVREALGGLHEEDKAYADKLFRAHDFPGDLLDACEQQAIESGCEPNIMVWLSQSPNDETSFGASNEQLEAVLLWNASCAERMAANPEGIGQTVKQYLAKISQKVTEGQLDESWAHAMPSISRIVIGDIMDIRFLGYKDVKRGGHYVNEDRTLTIWPYELEDENQVTHVCQHECCHALGGFKEKWLDEGFAEAFTRIINDQDPFGQSDVYNTNRIGVKKLLEGAGATCKDVSAFFLGNDREANEARLSEFLAQAYDGHDVVAVINKAYRESFDDKNLKLYNPHTQDNAYFVAALTASIISDLFDEARHNAQEVAARVKHNAVTTESDLRYIAFKYAYFLFADMADEQGSRNKVAS